MKIEQHPSGTNIAFDDKWHTYKDLDDTGKHFTSGTKFLKQFFEPFDRDGISAKYAKKHGLEQEEVLKDWSRKAERGRELGNSIHAYLEERLNNPDRKINHKIAAVHTDLEISGAILKRLPQADLALEELLDKYEFIRAEQIVADLDGCRAGMVDLVLREKKSGLLCLGDWKTNARIDLDNRWQKGTGCLEHLDDCSFIHYSLQMELYKQIGLKEKYFEEEMGRNVIIHITDDEHIFIPCPDMSTEVAAMVGSC